MRRSIRPMSKPITRRGLRVTPTIPPSTASRRNNSAEHHPVNHFLRLAVALGLITAVGPFAIDMYLPALPSIGANLNAGPNAVQATLMAFFIVFGVCQLFYGPLADIVGRKLPLYAGLALFTVGSIGCALAGDVEMLIAF